MRVEFIGLRNKNTQMKVSKNKAEKENKFSILIIQDFKYKFNNQKFLTKYKVKLCSWGDLQKTEKDIHVSTLIIRIF